MDFDLDAALRRVADDEHPGLGSIDAAVFHRVRATNSPSRAPPSGPAPSTIPTG